MYTITVSEKGGQQSTFEFNKPEVTIGRMKGNDIVLPKGNVSKRHSRIFANDGAFSIIDLESTNGTYVNGRKITGEQGIAEADKIYIGDFILQIEGAGAQAAPPPPAPPAAPPSPPGPPPPGPPASGLNEPLMPPLDPPSNSSQGAISSPALDFDDLDFDGPGSNPNTPPAPMTPAAPAAEAAPPAAPPAPSAPPAPATPGPSQDNRFGSQAPPAPQAPALGSSAPRLQADFTPRPGDAHTVDRTGPDIGALGRPEYSQVSALLSSNDLESEFDAAFHAAQTDVANALFESLTLQDLPMNPPTPDEQDRVRRAVDAAIGKVNPSVDREQLTNLLMREALGLGPVDIYLDDPEVHAIYVNRWDFVLVRRGDRLVQAKHAFSHPQLLLAAAYRSLGPREAEVFVDEMRFNDGTRVHVVLPPLAPEGAAITIRKARTNYPTLDDLVAKQALAPGMAEFLQRAIQAGRSILVAGPTGAGKSTLLSALAQTMPSGVRVVSIENGAHLKLPDNSIRLEPNPSQGFDARHLVHAALAMQPQRLVLDECRGPEAYDWVTAAAAGSEGSLATVHGTSASEALGRLESLALMGASNVSPRGLREQIARAINIVVVVNRNTTGGFRVHQITEVQGVDLDAMRLNDVFYYRVEGTGGAFHPTGYVPLFFEDMRHAGVDVDFGIFRE